MPSPQIHVATKAAKSLAEYATVGLSRAVLGQKKICAVFVHWSLYHACKIYSICEAYSTMWRDCNSITWKQIARWVRVQVDVCNGKPSTPDHQCSHQRMPPHLRRESDALKRRYVVQSKVTAHQRDVCKSKACARSGPKGRVRRGTLALVLAGVV